MNGAVPSTVPEPGTLGLAAVGAAGARHSGPQNDGNVRVENQTGCRKIAGFRNVDAGLTL